MSVASTTEKLLSTAISGTISPADVAGFIDSLPKALRTEKVTELLRFCVDKWEKNPSGMAHLFGLALEFSPVHVESAVIDAIFYAKQFMRWQPLVWLHGRLENKRQTFHDAYLGPITLVEMVAREIDTNSLNQLLKQGAAVPDAYIGVRSLLYRVLTYVTDVAPANARLLHQAGQRLIEGELEDLVECLARRHMLRPLMAVRDMGFSVEWAAIPAGKGEPVQMVSSLEVALSHDNKLVSKYLAELPEIRAQHRLDEPVNVSVLLAAVTRSAGLRPSPAPAGVEVMPAARRALALLRLSEMSPELVFPAIKSLRELRLVMKLYPPAVVMGHLHLLPPKMAAKAVDISVGSPQVGGGAGW